MTNEASDDERMPDCPRCHMPLLPLAPVGEVGTPGPAVAECERGHQAELASVDPTAGRVPLVPRAVWQVAHNGPVPTVLAHADVPSDPAADLRALWAQLERQSYRVRHAPDGMTWVRRPDVPTGQ